MTAGRQITRDYDDQAGLFAVSRIDPGSGKEIVVAFNTATAPITRRIEVDAQSIGFTSLHGRCPARGEAPGSISVTTGPLNYIVCAAR